MTVSRNVACGIGCRVIAFRHPPWESSLVRARRRINRAGNVSIALGCCFASAFSERTLRFTGRLRFDLSIRNRTPSNSCRVGCIPRRGVGLLSLSSTRLHADLAYCQLRNYATEPTQRSRREVRIYAPEAILAFAQAIANRCPLNLPDVATRSV